MDQPTGKSPRDPRRCKYRNIRKPEHWEVTSPPYGTSRTHSYNTHRHIQMQCQTSWVIWRAQEASLDIDLLQHCSMEQWSTHKATFRVRRRRFSYTRCLLSTFLPRPVFSRRQNTLPAEWLIVSTAIEISVLPVWVLNKNDARKLWGRWWILQPFTDLPAQKKWN